MASAEGAAANKPAQDKKPSERAANPEKDTTWRVKHGKDQTTLADVRANAKAEKRARQEDGDAAAQHSRKINITNYTSEDSFVKTKKLNTYYCSICGAYSLILQDSLAEIPFRRTDQSYVINESEYHKRNVDYADKSTNIRRKDGVEVQYRMFCRDCKQPMGYRLALKSEESPHSYFWKDALVQSQALCAAFKKQQPQQ
eukprot:GEMP01052923.1.p1 GENE.GEMP01052923.1~~GEMP01052923.1.p1  ORF type:complete len:199 (+),score=43.00 GEMP01052923.1:18-614(+)